MAKNSFIKNAGLFHLALILTISKFKTAKSKSILHTKAGFPNYIQNGFRYQANTIAKGSLLVYKFKIQKQVLAIRIWSKKCVEL